MNNLRDVKLWFTVFVRLVLIDPGMKRLPSPAVAASIFFQGTYTKGGFSGPHQNR